jgi:hypothetical protein
VLFRSVIRAFDFSLPVEIYDAIAYVYNIIDFPQLQYRKKMSKIEKQEIYDINNGPYVNPALLNQYYKINNNTGIN